MVSFVYIALAVILTFAVVQFISGLVLIVRACEDLDVFGMTYSFAALFTSCVGYYGANARNKFALRFFGICLMLGVITAGATSLVVFVYAGSRFTKLKETMTGNAVLFILIVKFQLTAAISALWLPSTLSVNRGIIRRHATRNIQMVTINS